jgi:hypothetical protein
MMVTNEKKIPNLETIIKKYLELMEMAKAWSKIHLHKTTFPLNAKR